MGQKTKASLVVGGEISLQCPKGTNITIIHFKLLPPSASSSSRGQHMIRNCNGIRE
ncbi:Oxysterol-Binding Protein-Related Protein 5 [Manis pentadactyla]|nr:Oxysterol-Binding Protein-Related Protein 5 [Manis pentadactyla]